MSFILGDDITATESAANGWALLLGLVDRGALTPKIAVEAPWTDVGMIAQRLMDREFLGKAVLQIPR